MALRNRAKMTTATVGVGAITLGATVAGFQSFAAAGVADAEVVPYVIEDGAAWEIGTGTYTAAGTTLSRTVTESSNAGAAINLSGSAIVYIAPARAQIADLSAIVSQIFAGHIEIGDSFRVNGTTFTPTTGSGIEMTFATTLGRISCRERGGANAWWDLAVRSLTLDIKPSDVSVGVFSATGLAMVQPVTVPLNAFAAGWNGSQKAATEDAVYDAAVAMLSSYRTILDASGSHIAGRVAGTYGMGHGDPLAITGTGTLYPLDIIYIDPADYPSAGGLAAKLRLRCSVAVNDVAPTGNFTIGLHPVTRPGTSGGTGLNIYTIGAAVAGSGVALNTPAADSINQVVGADFAIPAAGHYIVGVVSTATVAVNSHMHFSAALQLHHT